MTFPSYLSCNPILARELRLQMRDARAHWTLFGYIGTLCLVFLWDYAAWWRDAQVGGGIRHSPEPGASLFVSIISTQALLMLCVVPPLAAGALTRERERGMREMLTLTRLSPFALVSGKLFAAFLFVGLLVFASLPLACLCWLMGGESLRHMSGAYVCLLASSFFLCGLGLLWSSLARATTPAVLWTYLSIPIAVVPAYWMYSLHQSSPGRFSDGQRDILENVGRIAGNILFGGHLFGGNTAPGTGFCIFCVAGGVCPMVIASICTKRRYKRR